MTTVARHSAGVLGGDYLREFGRLGGVLLMTATTQVGNFGKFGDMRTGIVGMQRQGTVAGFAGHLGMLAGGPGGGLVSMTHHTSILSGKGSGMLAIEFERTWPIVAVLPECLWDNGAANYQEERQNGQQYHGRSN
ncbi:MAG TPA: hypothetical protein VKU19_37720 [Bryobacteraceae bacterium]|nr:hypothetical protein [Bryobacteraceae bacterium]